MFKKPDPSDLLPFCWPALVFVGVLVAATNIAVGRRQGAQAQNVTANVRFAAHLADPFRSDMSGIEFDSAGNNCRIYKVTAIAEDSPAAEAGIKRGDQIVAIDNRPAGQSTSAQIYKLFMVEGAEHSLTLRRANRRLTARIKLRRLL
ncbi:MAG TPA: PDZ domain-containing protein [Pyrinomonadaceae bacterium]|nr:PDZ domain-containing protein [Pyrinomonadaceae bacterium]